MKSPGTAATVRAERPDEGVGRLTLVRVERRNAINTQLADEFVAAVERFEKDGVRVAVLAAEGPAFCAGADLNDLDGAGEAVARVMRSLVGGSIHWTAAVAGAVRGAGLGILAACPRVLGTPDSTYGLPEVARGFFPTDLIEAQIETLGARAAFDLALTATPVGAAAASRMGLISDVVGAQELEERLDAETQRLLSYEPGTVAEGVRLWCARARRLVDARPSG